MNRPLRVLHYFGLLIYYRLTKTEHDMLELIYRAAEDLGGLYVKLAQFLSLRIEHLPTDYRLKLLIFYDQVPPEPMDIQKILQTELGSKAKTEIKQIENQPFASGTFGQVYKAQLIDNTTVIIKVKRKHLAEKL